MPDFVASHQRRIIAIAMLLAILRVIALAAIYPFFINVDEDLHFDVVVRYSLGRVPQAYDLFAAETLDWIGRYASPEFLMRPAAFSGGKFPTPLWKRPAAEAEPEIAATREAWKSEINFELSQPPLYYAIAAVWLRFGELLGLHGIDALFWTRCINALFVAALVWLTYLVARNVFPDDVELTVAAPLLIAFVPQQIFFSITNDVVSPLSCAALFYFLVRSAGGSGFTNPLAAAAGLLVAACYVTKLTNVGVISVAVIWLAFISIRQRRFTSLLTLLVCAALPIAAWMWWSAAHFGDLTGAAAKIALLGWTRKPIAAWRDHPLFSLDGMWVFVSRLAATFWRGELRWNAERLRSAGADTFYLVSSLALGWAAVVGAMRRMTPRLARASILLSAACLLASISLLALLSIQYDFGNCVYPSRSFPYFASGRLIAGCLLPFALMYVYGLRQLVPRRAHGLLLALVTCIIIFVTTTEVLVNRTVAASEHNWLHR